MSNRLDPHFYHPRFEKLLSVLQQISHETLGNIIKLSNHKWNPEEHPENTFRYIEINSVSRVTGEASFAEVPVKDAPSRAQMMVQKDDLIVSLTRPHHGSIALIDDDLDSCIASTGFAILRETNYPNLTRTYLHSVLRSQLCLSQMLQRSSGGNYPAITTDQLMRILIPIPKPEIQNDIVEIAQSAYTQKKQMDQDANAILDSIDDYILAKLGIEMPVIEENRCFVVRAEEIEGRIDPLYVRNIPHLRNLKASYPLIPLREMQTAKPQYGASERAVNGDPDTDCRYIRITDLDDYGNLLDGDWQTAEEIDSKYLLEDNDVLFARSGSVGRAFIYKSTFGQSIFAGYLIRLKFDPTKVNPSFVFHYTLTKIYKLWVYSVQRTTVQSNINSKEFQELEIPLPPLDVQNRIVKEVNKRLAHIAKIRQEGDAIVEAAKAEVEQILLAEA